MDNTAKENTAKIQPATNYEPQQGFDAKLDRVLVIISPDLVQPSEPEDSALLMRAVALAEATGCELELFHVCHDASLRVPFLGSEESFRREKKKLLERDATLIAELALRLQATGVAVSHDVRWDYPRTDAILRKIDDTRPDLVMKQSREYEYVLGLLGNTDWDLIRQSPAHVWFVTDDMSGGIERILTAVGAGDDHNEIIGAADYDVFRFANLVAAGFDAENTPVHAYEVPERLRSYAAYAPEFRGMSYPVSAVPTLAETRSDMARDHRRSVQALSEYFHLDPHSVYVGEGHPSDVLPKAAESMNADLIVMAARNLSRWERVVRSVTAEPVLAETPCDVVFVKDPSDLTVPEAKECPSKGVPAFDLERAIVDPEAVFGSPQRIVELTDISAELRNRILQVWEQDVRAKMVEDEEGGPIRATNVDVLERINHARANLEH